MNKTLIGSIVGGTLAMIAGFFVLKKFSISYLLGGVVGIFLGYLINLYMEKKNFYDRLLIFTSGEICLNCKKFRKNVWQKGKWCCPKCDLHMFGTEGDTNAKRIRTKN